jgi:GT2 family glycosyltransferase
MSSEVKVTVVIPTCDREEYLGEAIDSALSNLPPACEILIVNDGRPFSCKFLERLRTDSVRVVNTTGNTGAAAARNLGVQAARGGWIFFLDDDDLTAKGYWPALLKAIQNLLPSGAEAWGFSVGKKFEDRMLAKELQQSSENYAFTDENSKSLKAKLSGLGMGFWVSRALYERVGGLDERLKVNEDTDLCLRLVKSGAKCIKTKSVGVFVYSGARPEGVKRSVTKSYGYHERLSFFHLIIQKNLPSIASCAATEKWLWRRYLKFAGRVRSKQALKFFTKECKLSSFHKLSLLLYYFGNFLVARKIS